MFSIRLVANILRPLVFCQSNLPRTNLQLHIAPIVCHQDVQSLPARSYSKGKDKLKTKARDLGVKFAKHQFTDDQLRELIPLDAYHTQLRKSVDHMKKEFIENLSLRSTTGSIDTLRVTVDGQEHELQEIGQIVRKNPKTIVINLAAFPQTIPMVLAALQKSGMNLNPQQDGTTIFIPVPKITKEHRENLAKNAKTLFNKCRDAIKDHQNGIVRKLKKQKDISSDENHSVQLQVSSIGDTYIVEAEQLLLVKQNELIGGGSDAKH